MQDVTKEIQESENSLKSFLPDSPHVVWRINGLDAHEQPQELHYVQSELSFFEKQDFMALATGYFERLVSGEFGIDLKSLMNEFGGGAQVQIPTSVTAEDAEKMISDNADLITAMVKIIGEIPDLQMKIILIALGVPPRERDFVSTVLRGPIWKGGLTDEQGFMILKTFISQNAGPIRDFFAQGGRELVEHFQREVLEESQEETPQNGDTPGGTLSNISAPGSGSTPTT